MKKKKEEMLLQQTTMFLLLSPCLFRLSLLKEKRKHEKSRKEKYS